jgi:hypothetical protein
MRSGLADPYIQASRAVEESREKSEESRRKVADECAKYAKRDKISTGDSKGVVHPPKMRDAHWYDTMRLTIVAFNAVSAARDVLLFNAAVVRQARDSTRASTGLLLSV